MSEHGVRTLTKIKAAVALYQQKEREAAEAALKVVQMPLDERDQLCERNSVNQEREE